MRTDYVSQRPNGGFTEVAPDVQMDDGGLGGRSGPIGWEVFQPASLMWLYKYYGAEHDACSFLGFVFILSVLLLKGSPNKALNFRRQHGGHEGSLATDEKVR